MAVVKPRVLPEPLVLSESGSIATTFAGPHIRHIKRVWYPIKAPTSQAIAPGRRRSKVCAAHPAHKFLARTPSPTEVQSEFGSSHGALCNCHIHEVIRHHKVHHGSVGIRNNTTVFEAIYQRSGNRSYDSVGKGSQVRSPFTRTLNAPAKASAFAAGDQPSTRERFPPKSLDSLSRANDLNRRLNVFTSPTGTT